MADSIKDTLSALANSGIDIKCGACMEVAFTGVTTNHHSCSGNWQPIETAPKDGTNVLLWWPFWCSERATIGWFGYKGIQQWVAAEALEGDGDPPTHWMPLPESPKP